MMFALWLAVAQAADPMTASAPTPVEQTDVAPEPAPIDAPTQAVTTELAARAEPTPPTTTPPIATPTPQASRALRQARGMKVAGTVLTSVGIATGTLSAGLAVWGAAMTPTCEFECMGPVFAFSGGAIGAGITGVFLGAGIPLWVVGQRHERELSAPLQTMIVVPTADRHGGGVAMAFQF